jgi:hypothetical protein
LVGDVAFAAHGVRAAGFDAVSLAHTKLTSQLGQTKAMLDELGIPNLGAGPDAYSPIIVERDAERTAFLAATTALVHSELEIACVRDARFTAAVKHAQGCGLDNLYLLLNVVDPGLRLESDADFAALMVDFDGIVVTGRKFPLPPIRSSASFVAAPGPFHDANARVYRWATAVWASQGQCEFSPISQRRHPPLTRTGSRLPMRLLGVDDTLREVAEPDDKRWF